MAFDNPNPTAHPAYATALAMGSRVHLEVGAEGGEQGARGICLPRHTYAAAGWLLAEARLRSHTSTSY